jgi:hypothetical protein
MADESAIIDVSDARALCYWSEALGASEDELRRMVEHVGPRRGTNFLKTALNCRLATLKGGDPVRDDQGTTGRQDSDVGSTRSAGGKS